MSARLKVPSGTSGRTEGGANLYNGRDEWIHFYYGIVLRNLYTWCGLVSLSEGSERIATRNAAHR